MYAAGDTEEPAIDSVDYMEDLLVEFLSDLVSVLRRPPCVSLCFSHTRSVGLSLRSDRTRNLYINRFPSPRPSSAIASTNLLCESTSIGSTT
jgi:hypothetical protein